MCIRDSFIVLSHTGMSISAGHYFQGQSNMLHFMVMMVTHFHQQLGNKFFLPSFSGIYLDKTICFLPQINVPYMAMQMKISLTSA